MRTSRARGPHVPSVALAALVGIPSLVSIASCRKKPERTPEELAARVTATVTVDPPTIALRWAQNPADTTSVDVYRRLRGEPRFGEPIARGLAKEVTSFTDAAVKRGVAYEYYVERALVKKPWWSAGTVASAIEGDLVEVRGKLVLVVEESVSAKLAAELARLEDDLAGDGWVVARFDVDERAPPAAIKAKIRAERDAATGDGDKVTAALLFGHVPVPYSGDTAPDGHRDPKSGPVHTGAWPADMYYADMVGAWTDETADTRKLPTQPADARNANVPGDGKFDQHWGGGVTETPYTFKPLWLAPTLYGDLALAIGRVDLSNLPAFAPKTEIDLLRQYLDKDHRYRHKQLTAEPRALIADRVGYRPLALERLPGDFLPTAAWNGAAALFGEGRAVAGPWIETARGTSAAGREGFLFAYAACPGHFDACEDVVTTKDLAARPPRALFTLLYGSYFGDWDHEDDLLRAVLATPYGLTSGWGNPAWYLYPLGLGEPVGEAARVSQRATPLAHLALLGDPTLRLQVVLPPSALEATATPGGAVALRWAPSSEALAGYRLYRSLGQGKPFELVAKAPPGVTTLVDAAPGEPLPARYMVRAVRLEVTPSGSFFNASQGAFAVAPRPLGPAPEGPRSPPRPRAGDAKTSASAPPETPPRPR